MPCWTELWEQLEGHDEVPAGFPNDGCTLAPGSIRGREVWPACVIHDHDYHHAGPDISRWASDRRFLTNLYKCHRFYGGCRVRSAAWAFGYFKVVRRVGGDFFKRSPTPVTGDAIRFI